MGWYREADAKTRRVFWTCGAGWAMDSADGLVFQYMIPVLITAFGMTLTQASYIASANYIAAAVGGWLGGWLSDRFGRTRILQLTILWFSVFSFLSGFAQNYEQLFAARVLQGVGFGAEWAVGAVLLGEMIAPKHRGKALGVVHSGAAIGSGVAALLAGPVAAMFPADIGWRVVFWIGLLPAVLVFFVRRGSDDPEIYKAAVQRAAETGKRPRIADIFGKRMLRITLLASLLSLGAQGAAFAVSNYLTTFLHVERGMTVAMAGSSVMLNSLGGFFGFLVNAYISDQVGRRGAFRLFGAGFILSAAIYLFAPLGNNAAFLIPAGVVYGFFQFGIYASFGPYFTELFPTEVRATGQAFAYNLGRGGAALFITGVALVAKTLPLSVAMAILAIMAMVCSMAATLLLPETVGRDLQSLSDLDGGEASSTVGQEGKVRRQTEQDARSATNTVG
ncbi:MFS transporter [Caulobacter sp.]|uniref:MFS transporter n=1 Tax=Caulobacter sp. TaxID=78 RepID=UPI002B4A2BC6|nr:MFS transporter [Caulobacter sp.]HJV43615.1 MFS transporter [Caulobacter sp.]